jgi:CMP-2-keto-3-deoxyoctulosonic acid synthetase
VEANANNAKREKVKQSVPLEQLREALSEYLAKQGMTQIQVLGGTEAIAACCDSKGTPYLAINPQGGRPFKMGTTKVRAMLAAASEAKKWLKSAAADAHNGAH